MIITDSVTQLPRVWYHGTTSLNAKSLEEDGIDFTKGRVDTDFGQGFYLTSNWEQAYRWAKNGAKIAKVRNRKQKDDIFPVIAEYEVITGGLDHIGGKLFDKTGIDWAEFVLFNRTRTPDQIITYDMDNFVYGPMADGKDLRLLVEQFQAGDISPAKFVKRAVSKRYTFPIDHQLSVHTSESKQFLALKGVFNIEAGLWESHVKS